jgi:hypothetical protein
MSTELMTRLPVPVLVTVIGEEFPTSISVDGKEIEDVSSEILASAVSEAVPLSATLYSGNIVSVEVTVRVAFSAPEEGEKRTVTGQESPAGIVEHSSSALKSPAFVPEMFTEFMTRGLLPAFEIFSLAGQGVAVLTVPKSRESALSVISLLLFADCVTVKV